MSVITNGRTDQDVLGSIPVLAVKSFPPLSRTPPLSYSVPRSHIVTSSFHGTLRKRSHSGDMLLLKSVETSSRFAIAATHVSIALCSSLGESLAAEKLRLGSTSFVRWQLPVLSQPKRSGVRYRVLRQRGKFPMSRRCLVLRLQSI
ncbi:unnamed protein product [Peronospora belbahrii]|uniref:Uncharacterized protein n=1 Tax=Peronospora belbahrii TaxID=622444 RepID=A0AAU9KXG9_9STRA|nr:unnamed protein product [Peronospora belbahrii]